MPGAVEEGDASDAEGDASQERREQLKLDLKLFSRAFEAQHGRKLTREDLTSDATIPDKDVRQSMRRLYLEYKELRSAPPHQ